MIAFIFFNPLIILNNQSVCSFSFFAVIGRGRGILKKLQESSENGRFSENKCDN